MFNRQLNLKLGTSLTVLLSKYLQIAQSPNTSVEGLTLLTNPRHVSISILEINKLERTFCKLEKIKI